MYTATVFEKKESKICHTSIHGVYVECRLRGMLRTINLSSVPCASWCPGVASASKNEYQETPGGEGGRCVRVKVEKIQEP
jgi:hypothetical protein